jgi:hypothetical protein
MPARLSVKKELDEGGKFSTTGRNAAISSDREDADVSLSGSTENDVGGGEAGLARFLRRPGLRFN